MRPVKGLELMGLLRGNRLTDEEARALYDDLKKLMNLCDDLNCEDAFGTEGWKHCIGWDE